MFCCIIILTPRYIFLLAYVFLLNKCTFPVHKKLLFCPLGFCLPNPEGWLLFFQGNNVDISYGYFILQKYHLKSKQTEHMLDTNYNILLIASWTMNGVKHGGANFQPQEVSFCVSHQSSLHFQSGLLKCGQYNITKCPIRDDLDVLL